MNCNEVGNFIAKLRKENGYTQKTLGIKLGVTSKAVSKWECGNSLPDISLIKEMAKIFHVSVEDILNGGVDENENKNKPKFPKKIRIIIYSLIEIILILSLIIVSSIPKYGKYDTYRLYSENGEFFLTGVLSFNDKNLYLYLGDMKLSTNATDIGIYGVSYELLVNDVVAYKIGDISTTVLDSSNQSYKLKKIIGDMIISVSGEEINIDYSYVFQNINKLKLRINYISTDNQLNVIDVPIGF